MPLLVTLLLSSLFAESWQLPIRCENRHSFRQMKLTKIGHFGMMRAPRPEVPAHFHTAIDICRPDSSYEHSPILPVKSGKVISMRNDGPYAQVIISHGDTLWSVYEHLSGIKVTAGDSVTAETVIGRFMNRRELNSYGWHFNHLHLEIMKKPPLSRDTLPGQPNLQFRTYGLVCFTTNELNEHYFDPLLFFREKWK